MLTLTSRVLRELNYDAGSGQFLGRVEITYLEAADETPRLARILAIARLGQRSRFTQIADALLDEAEDQLRSRLSSLLGGPDNIFAPRAAA